MIVPFPTSRRTEEAEQDTWREKLIHVRHDSDFTRRLRLKLQPQSLPTSRPASTLRNREFLESADTLISTCRLHLHSKPQVHRELSQKLEHIKASVKSILEIGRGNKKKFNTGRRQFLEEEQLTRDQMTKMLKTVRMEFKKAYGVL